MRQVKLPGSSLIFFIAILFLSGCDPSTEMDTGEMQHAKLLVRERQLNRDTKLSRMKDSAPDSYQTLALSSNSDAGDSDETPSGQKPEDKKAEPISQLDPLGAPDPAPVLLSVLEELGAEFVESDPVPQTELFTTNDLEELSQSTKHTNSSLIGGVVSRGEQAAAVVEPLPPREEKKDPKTDAEASLPVHYSGQARGYTMLYLMHPGARAAVEKQISALLDSGLQELYLGVLTDGTFSKDFEYLSTVIRRLNTENRTLTLTLYLTNGSTMRRFDSTPIRASFTTINPEEFRERIRHDTGTRNEFVALAQETVPAFELNSRLAPGNRNIAVVQLEDNLDDEAYLEMVNLAKSVLPEDVEFVRNPCPECFKGNETNAFGGPKESHNVEELSALGSRDGFTLDGTSYHFNGESTHHSLSIDQVRRVITDSLNQNVSYFGLWRAERQGIRGDTPIHPDDRNFEIPSDEQLALEIQLLRQGLGWRPEPG